MYTPGNKIKNINTRYGPLIWKKLDRSKKVVIVKVKPITIKIKINN
jgi:hypothetical protein